MQPFPDRAVGPLGRSPNNCDAIPFCEAISGIRFYFLNTERREPEPETSRSKRVGTIYLRARRGLHRKNSFAPFYLEFEQLIPSVRRSVPAKKCVCGTECCRQRQQAKNPGHGSRTLIQQCRYRSIICRVKWAAKGYTVRVQGTVGTIAGHSYFGCALWTSLLHFLPFGMVLFFGCCLEVSQQTSSRIKNLIKPSGNILL